MAFIYFRLTPKPSLGASGAECLVSRCLGGLAAVWVLINGKIDEDHFGKDK